jgi:hypothetical protein
MDDLLDLEWDKKPGGPTLSQQKPPSQAFGNGTSSSYNFDALTRSLPQTRQPSSNTTSSGTKARSQQISPTNSRSSNGPDAFSSLLGFDSGSASGQSAFNAKLSMAEQLRKDNQQKLGLPTAPSSTQPQSSSSNISAWEGLDSLLGGSNTSLRATAM